MTTTWLVVAVIVLTALYLRRSAVLSDLVPKAKSGKPVVGGVR